MTTIFSRIIDGELPGRFVWRDERAVAFLSINPITPGHTLVVPVAEVDHWIDLDPADWSHVADVARQVAIAIDRVWPAEKVAMMMLGFDVPHVHAHVISTRSMGDVDFGRAEIDPDPAMMDAAAASIRSALTELGAAGVSDA